VCGRAGAKTAGAIAALGACDPDEAATEDPVVRCSEEGDVVEDPGTANESASSVDACWCGRVRAGDSNPKSDTATYPKGDRARLSGVRDWGNLLQDSR
jgi:hypothetical protein